jgi:hypothetical protein
MTGGASAKTGVTARRAGNAAVVRAVFAVVWLIIVSGIVLYSVVGAANL